jgi:hypothetical protein
MPVVVFPHGVERRRRKVIGHGLMNLYWSFSDFQGTLIESCGRRTAALDEFNAIRVESNTLIRVAQLKLRAPTLRARQLVAISLNLKGTRGTNATKFRELRGRHAYRDRGFLVDEQPCDG